MSDFQKFKEQFSSKEKFHSSLMGQNISDKGYEHVFKVWVALEIKPLKDYHDLYLKSDVSLLADVFQKFRNGRLKKFRLCQSHYLSAAALRWNAILNTTKSKLDVILDVHMYLFFEKSCERLIFRYFLDI